MSSSRPRQHSSRMKKLMNPGPAISTLLSSPPSSLSFETIAWAMARGFFRAWEAITMATFEA